MIVDVGGRSPRWTAWRRPCRRSALYDEGGGAFGGAETIIGSVAGADEGLEDFPLNSVQGRLLTADDEGSHVVVMGSDLARKENVGAGDTWRSAGSTSRWSACWSRP